MAAAAPRGLRRVVKASAVLLTSAFLGYFLAASRAEALAFWMSFETFLWDLNISCTTQRYTSPEFETNTNFDLSRVPVARSQQTVVGGHRRRRQVDPAPSPRLRQSLQSIGKYQDIDGIAR